MGLGKVDLPDGRYGVPDPRNGSKWTFWVVRSGRLKVWPPGVRYAPYPPSWLRRDTRQDWYDEVYFPWVFEVIAEIGADLDAAALAFTRRAPLADRVPANYGARQRSRPLRLDQSPRPRRVTQRQRERAAAREQAVALHKAGKSYAEIAVELMVSKTTAHRYVKGGAADGPAHRAMLLDRLNELGRGLAAAKVWSADPQERERIAERLAEIHQLRERLSKEALA